MEINQGTYFENGTESKVMSILEDARKTGKRVRLWYGNTMTGKDWLEEHDVIGKIGRSTGTRKVPLLIKSERSIGGGAILTDNIVKITIDKHVVYQHPNYQEPEIIIRPITADDHAPGYFWAADVNCKHWASFKSEKQAIRWKEFMLGQRNSK